MCDLAMLFKSALNFFMMPNDTPLAPLKGGIVGCMSLSLTPMPPAPSLGKRRGEKPGSCTESPLLFLREGDLGDEFGFADYRT